MISESINLGQVNISIDITIIGKVRDIKIGLTPVSKRHFTNIIRERKTNNRFVNKKANCHSFTNNTLHNEINATGTEKKNRCGL
tara:strand:- start:1594 stop:1845 length:252 start_codon:yes stop_codon:yes gene_type:complete